jgi:hypothetical protein
MSYSENPYQPSGSFYPVSAAESAVDERVDFIRKTYVHLTAAVLGFAFIIAVLLQISAVQNICQSMFHTPWSYLIAMFALMAVSWVCDKWAANAASVSTQYAGLIVYTIAEALFFTPMIWLAGHFEGALMTAGAVTGVVFIGLTLSVFITKADFSFMRSALMIGTLGALAVAMCMMFIPGATQGWMLILMGVFVVLACGYILYNTSNVLHHYPVGMHVAASLALFASLTTLFWYVLQIVIALSGRD